MKKMKKIAALMLLPMLCAFVVVSCNTTSSTPSFKAVLVVCQGNYGSGNGSITHYNTETKTATQDYYALNNAGRSLGDTPMSLSMWSTYCFIPVKGEVAVIDPRTGMFKRSITGLNKPNTVGVVGLVKGFMTDVSEPTIKIFHAETGVFVDTINLSSAADKLVLVGDKYIYTNQWSYGKQILKINAISNKVEDSIEVGVQPSCLAADASGNLWTITDGGYDGNPLGNVDPQIVKVRIDEQGKMTIAHKWTLTKGPNYQIGVSSWGASIYYTAGDKLYKFEASATTPPTTPIITVAGANFSNVVEDPFTGDIYLSDVKDYVSKGAVYRYSKDFKLIDTFETGIMPKIFGFVL